MNNEGIRLETLIEIRELLSDSSDFLREHCCGLFGTNPRAWDRMCDLRHRQMTALCLIKRALPEVVIPITGNLPVLEAAQ